MYSNLESDDDMEVWHIIIPYCGREFPAGLIIDLTFTPAVAQPLIIEKLAEFN